MQRYQRTVISSTSALTGTQTWESPSTIDNSGVANVSAALTDWLSSTGSPGDIFRLRRAGSFAGTYFIPQGIRIGKSMAFDLNGCTLLTGPEDGSQYSPLWNDWEEQSNQAVQWPKHRVCVNVQATDVDVFSSLPDARIQGSGRIVDYLGGFPEMQRGVVYNAALEMQHAIRLGGGTASTPKVANVDIDLTNIALEFVQGDGVYLADGCTNITIHGRNMGSGVVGGVVSTRDKQNLRGDVGGLGGTDAGGLWVPTAAVYPGIHHTGRQGIATDFTVIGLVINGISIWRVARSVIDLEAAGTGDFVNDVQILNTESGIHRLGWITAAARSVSNCLIQDNVCYEPINVTTTGSASFRHSNWRIIRNVGGCVERPGPVFAVDRIDGLEIRDNFQTIDATADGINTGTSTGVVISPAEAVQFPPEGTPPPTGPFDPYMGLDETGTTIPDTNYTIPTGAIYLAPNGNDALLGGSESQAVRTINRAVTLVPNNGTIVVRGGTYRDWYHNGSQTLYGNINTKGVTIQAYPHEQPWFDGADVVNTGWTSDGAGHWFVDWDTPTFGGGHYYDLPPDQNTFMLHLSNWNSTTQAGDPQQVIFDGAYFDQVGTLAAVTATSFYYDWNARRIYIGQNPAGHTVQLAARPCFAVLGGSVNHTIRGIGFRNYASAENVENVGNATLWVGGSGVRTFENLVFYRNSGHGWHWFNPAPGGTMRRCVHAFNGANGGGWNGAGPGGARNDTLIEESIFNSNNMMRFGNTCQSACESAGMKNTNMNGAVVRRCVFENTKGQKASGLWFDVRNKELTIVFNVIRGCGEGTSGGSIFYELSGGGTADTIIASNLIYNNTAHGLKLVDITQAKVYNNTVVQNFFPMWLIDDDRTEFNTDNVEVVNNLMVDDLRFHCSIEGENLPAPNTQPSTFFNDFDYNAHHKLDGSSQVLYRWIQSGAISTYQTAAQLFAAKGWEQHGIDIAGGTDPFFEDKTNEDFRVRSTSVAYQSGKALPADVAAALGLPTGAVISRGAYDWPGRA